MADTTDDAACLAPNHHRDHPGFSGLTGWLAAHSMTVGRTAAAQLAIRATDLRAGEHLVDIGCGPGVAARLAARGGAIVTGVDPATVMLDVARRADRRGVVTWRRGVAESLPLPDHSQDVAWSVATVHHWPDLTAALAEVHRVLAPGGRYLAIERRVKPGATGLGSHGWTNQQADTFAELCESAGLGRVEVSRHAGRRGSLVAVLAHLSS